MAWGGKPVSRDMIFRAVKQQVGGSLGRTLTECIYWSQYAQHAEDNAPLVWKTGAQLGSELGCNPRTANTHLKKLAFMGFWKITYRPRPGSPSKVTWLRYTEVTAEVLALARRLSEEQRRSGKQQSGSPPDGVDPSASTHTHSAVQQSQSVTLKHLKTSQPTSVGPQKGFLLTKGQKASALTKEAPKKIYLKVQGEGSVKAPKYESASAAEEAFGNIVRAVLEERKLPQWDWSSVFTWRYTKELHAKLEKKDISSSQGCRSWIEVILDEWHWLRICMAYRYASHDGNLHRPTPMALAHEFEKLFSALVAKKSKPQAHSGPSGFDDEFI